METDIFLSYVREDEGRARELAGALEQEGYSVFWDRQIPVGQSWHSYIGQALDGAKCVVVAWSSSAIQSEWVIEEANSGKNRGILVPVLFDGAAPPFGFGSIQAADLSEWKRGRPSQPFTDLLSGVARIVPAARSEPPPEPSASSVRQQTVSAPAQPPAHRSYRAWLFGGLIAVASVGVAGGSWWFTRGQTPVAPDELQQSEPVEIVPDPPTTTAEAPEETTVATTAEVPEIDKAFRDCDDCPEMVVVPAGKFMMGSPEDEAGHYSDESPQREVTVPAFAIGKREVTFDEWDLCVADGGCEGYRPGDQDWGRGRRPVINVSWDHAQTYVKWLREVTGDAYRLPSEAEWEYAARAGTKSAYALPAPDGSDDIADKGLANCDGCGSEWDNQSTAPVGSFATNAFGLHDTAGNVWEWVEDCWHDSYEGAPNDGSAWTSGDCGRRVLRGGSWNGRPGLLRSAYRSRNFTVNRYGYIGFRVARTLP